MMCDREIYLEKLLSNEKEFERNYFKLTDSDWYSISKMPNLTQSFLSKYSHKILWRYVFYHNRNVTEYMVRTRLPLTLYSDILFDLSYMIRVNRTLSDNVLKEIIETVNKKEDLYSLVAGFSAIGRAEFFFENVKNKRVLPHEFKNRYNRELSRKQINVGDKVHTDLFNRCIVAEKKGSEYVLINLDNEGD